MQNLSIGSSGQAVMDLQKMLNANGAKLVVDGKFGPLTQAALKSYQGSHGLTPDGIYGPKTAAVLNPPKTITSTPTTTTKVSPQKAVLTAVADVAKNAATIGKPPVSFAEALDLASKDPNIIAKYADMAKLDKQGFLQQVQAMQAQYSTQAQQQKMDFERDRKSLAEMNAAAGTAYSGFRGKAQSDLAKTQAGIITSTRSQQQQQLNALTSAFEGKYGTGATPKASLTLENPLAGNVSISGLDQTGGGTSTLAGQQAGGITGTVAPAKAAEIRGSALDAYNTTLFPI